MRRSDLEDGTRGAGRFFYLAKNAFSGKIRFNSKNEFNSPMRKNSKCPRVEIGSIRRLSDTIRHLRITTKDFARYVGVRDGFVYLDPPYLNNTNGHYNAVVSPKEFLDFVRKAHGLNKIMISEHNKPDTLMLGRNYRVYHIKLKRSLQYFTRDDSNEIIAINYRPDGKL